MTTTQPAGEHGLWPGVRSARYVDTRSGRAAAPVFSERVKAGEDISGWTEGFSDDALTFVVTAAPDQRLVVSDLVGGRWVRREVLPAKGGTVLALAVNRAGTRAYSASDDGTVTTWDLTDREGFGAQIRTPQVAGSTPPP